MNLKLAAVLARRLALSQDPAGLLSPALNVTAICAEVGISRQTYYVAARAFAEKGLEGLLPQSRRPHHSPNQTSAELEDRVVVARKALEEEGWDCGAVSIADRLRRDGVTPPAPATINRILKRRGLIVAQPQKRPKSSWKRFNYTERNGCWQIDAFYWKLADGAPAAVFQLIDDCTRLELANLVAPAETAEAALACFLDAVARHGVPAMLLSDNGLAFSGRLRGWRSALEIAAAALGVKTVQSSPYHPQTCGKNERAHQTCQKWLRHKPAAATPAELQALLDTYRELYNTIRPHQSLNGRTPAQAAANAPIAEPGPVANAPHPRITQHLVNAHGDIGSQTWALSAGRALKGQRVTVIRDGDHLTVLHGRKLIRELNLDPTRRYQKRNP
jgi:transposase InsO family protein